MGTAIPVKRRLGAADLRKRACASQDTDQARRLLALAAVLDGQSRGAAARIGGMDCQTLRDWVHAYNAEGPNGLINATAPGRPPKLTKAQKEKLRPIIVAGPDPVKDGVVRRSRPDPLLRQRFLHCLCEFFLKSSITWGDCSGCCGRALHRSAPQPRGSARPKPQPRPVADAPDRYPATRTHACADPPPPTSSSPVSLCP